jgi:hypothetical protein
VGVLVKASKPLFRSFIVASAFFAALCACVSLDSLRAGRDQPGVDGGTDAKTDASGRDAGVDSGRDSGVDSGDGGADPDGSDIDGGTDGSTDGSTDGGETCVLCEDFETNDFASSWLVQRQTPDAGTVTLLQLVANAPSPVRAVEIKNPAFASGTTFNTPTTDAGATELDCSFHMNAVADTGGGASEHVFALMVTNSGASTQVFTFEGLNRARFGDADDAGVVKFSKQVAIPTQFAPNTFHKYRIRLVDGAAEVSVDDQAPVALAAPVKTPIDRFFIKFGTVLVEDVINDGGLPYPVTRLVDSVRCVKR